MDSVVHRRQPLKLSALKHRRRSHFHNHLIFLLFMRTCASSHRTRNNSVSLYHFGVGAAQQLVAGIQGIRGRAKSSTRANRSTFAFVLTEFRQNNYLKNNMISNSFSNTACYDGIASETARILQQSLSQIDDRNYFNDNSSREESNYILCIGQAIQLLHVLTTQAESFSLDHPWNGPTIETSVLLTSEDADRIVEPYFVLANNALLTSNSLKQLINRLRPNRSRKCNGSKAWRALQTIVSCTLHKFALSSTSTEHQSTWSVHKRSHAIALLALGAVLSIQLSEFDHEDDQHVSNERESTKMLSSALFSDLSCHVYASGLSHDSTKEDAIIYSISRAVVLDLLGKVNPGGGISTCINGDTVKNTAVIDIQVINKLARGFEIGDRIGMYKMNEIAEDDELQSAVSKVVDVIFGSRIQNESENGLYANGTDYSCKDSDAAVLSLVACTRPWRTVQADRLVEIATDLDLWFAAENICDAATESARLLESDKQQYDIAQSTASAIIDAALGYRQYRRADQFATKYYSFGGPERFAEACYRHCCSTINKLVKRKNTPLIERQVDRVDSAVLRASRDLGLTSKSHQKNMRDAVDETSIESMSDNVREFSLRRLRAANLNSEALRLAKIWGKTYEYDPIQMMHELQQRKLTYLQWDDSNCPGHTFGLSPDGYHSSLPKLISDPIDLEYQFMSLLENDCKDATIGFDCEWGDHNGVSILQVSSTSKAILLDILALTSTKEGCDVLRKTVGRLFSGSFRAVQYVVGFSCKEDFSRLRASPSIPGNLDSKHWFPPHEKLKARDLRQFIAETTPNLGTRGSPIGLSAACEVFLGKALDKAEQCSDWSNRPLSPEQREYAALDAWACAAIHVRMASTYSVLHIP